MTENTDVFHIMTTARPMRRMKPDPVPQELLEEILDAAVHAPNSMNTQPYTFLIVRDRESKAFFGDRYHAAMEERFTPLLSRTDLGASNERNLKTAMALGKHIVDVPVLLFILGRRDWPMAVPDEERIGLAPPSFGSVYPCVQNILLGCRAKGLGSSLTTMHQVFEEDLLEHFAIPDTHGIVAVIPIGYPKGRFGPLTRKPSRELTFHERWGQRD